MFTRIHLTVMRRRIILPLTMNDAATAPVDPSTSPDLLTRLAHEAGRFKAMYERAERERVDAQAEKARLTTLITDVADELAELHDADESASPEYLATIIDTLRDGRVAQ